MKKALRAQKPTRKITILFVDDSPYYRKCLCMLLESDERIEVVGQAGSGREGVKKALALQPDVILMDIAMPLLNGLDAAEQILVANPAAKVMMLTVHDDDAYIKRAIAIGAVGFITKVTAVAKLADAICAVAKGETSFSPAIMKRMR